MLVVIDALDEATVDGHNELAAVIATQWQDTPNWLRLLVTSRADASVVSQLQCLRPFILDAGCPDNRADVQTYLEEMLASAFVESASHELVSTILAKSEGLFLYVKAIVDEIQKGRLSSDAMEAFPAGLAGYFQQFFDRQFAEPGLAAYQRNIRPILDVIVAQREPLPLTLLLKCTKVEEFELRQQWLPQLGSLFPIRPSRDGPRADTIAPFHKTASDWLTERDEFTGLFRAGRYAVDRRAGDRTLAEACWREYEAGPDALSAYSMRHLPAHLVAAERWDELVVLAENAVTADDARLSSVGIEALSFLQQSEQTLGLADSVIGRVGCCLNVALQRTLPSALESALTKAIRSEETGAGPASCEGLLDSLYVVMRYLGTMAIAEVAQQTLLDNAGARGRETVFQALRGGTLGDNLEIFRDVYWRDRLVPHPVLHLLRDIPPRQMRKLQDLASALITSRLDHFAAKERADTDRTRSMVWALFAILVPLSRIQHIAEPWGELSVYGEKRELFKEQAQWQEKRSLHLWPWSLTVGSVREHRQTFFLDVAASHSPTEARGEWLDYLSHQRIRTKQAGPSYGPKRFQWLMEIGPADLELIT